MKNLFLSIVLILISFGSQSQNFPLYRVTGVTDGDTYDLSGFGVKVRSRLNYVDTPETNQPFGKAAKDSVKKLLLGKLVYADLHNVDFYGRRLVSLYLPQFLSPPLRLDSVLISKGWAWFYSAYGTSSMLLQAETNARAYGRGLWNCEDQVEPWVWRGFNARFRQMYWSECPIGSGVAGGGPGGAPGTTPGGSVSGTVIRSTKKVVSGTAGGGALGITGPKKQVRAMGDTLR